MDVERELETALNTATSRCPDESLQRLLRRIASGEVHEKFLHELMSAGHTAPGEVFEVAAARYTIKAAERLLYARFWSGRLTEETQTSMLSEVAGWLESAFEFFGARALD